jgi:hypothetical protein
VTALRVSAANERLSSAPQACSGSAQPQARPDDDAALPARIPVPSADPSFTPLSIDLPCISRRVRYKNFVPLLLWWGSPVSGELVAGEIRIYPLFAQLLVR